MRYKQLIFSFALILSLVKSAAADDAEKYYTLAQTYSTQHNFEKSLAEAQEAVRLDPKNVTYLFYLGGQNCAAGKPRESLDAYKKSVEFSKSPLVMWSGKREAAFWVMQMEAFNKLIGNPGNQSSQKNDRFTGSWVEKLSGIGEITSPAHSKEELVKMRAEAQSMIGNELDTLHIQQFGSLARAMDLQQEYTGCTYDRWIVLGNRQEGNEKGCKFERSFIITAQLMNENTLEGKIAMIGTADHSQACRPAIGTTETLFTAKKK